MTFETTLLFLNKSICVCLALAIGAYAIEKKKYCSLLMIALVPLLILNNMAKWPDFFPILVIAVLGVIFISTRKPYVFWPEDYGSDALYWITQIALATLDYIIQMLVGILIFVLFAFAFIFM